MDFVEETCPKCRSNVVANKVCIDCGHIIVSDAARKSLPRVPIHVSKPAPKRPLVDCRPKVEVKPKELLSRLTQLSRSLEMKVSTIFSTIKSGKSYQPESLFEAIDDSLAAYHRELAAHVAIQLQRRTHVVNGSGTPFDVRQIETLLGMILAEWGET